MEKDVFFEEEESMSMLDIIVGVSISVCCIAWVTVMFM